MSEAVRHARRRDRLRRHLARLDVDALLVTRLVNVRYLSGFTGSNGALLVGAGRDLLATDGRYRIQAGAECPDLELLLDRVVAPALARRCAAQGGRRLGVEEHDVSLELADVLRAAGVDPVPTGRAVEGQRASKDESELAALAEACRISDLALGELLPKVRVGHTERQIARALENRMVEHGAEGRAFATIVAAGPHAAVPHHRPTDRPVAAGDLLTIDFGALWRGYHADCTRTFVVGAPPAGWQQEIHDLVAAAQAAGRDALAPGAEGRAVDAAARAVVVDAGYGEAFVHGLGHGVGLEIHEAPMLGLTSTARLADRTALTVEPGVYREGRGGVRIEDTLAVRSADGAGAGAPRPLVEPLTASPRELLVLG